MTEIYFENQQDKVEITEKTQKLIETVIEKTLEADNLDLDVIVSVTVCNNEEIHIINKEHRDIDSPTDVLSFPVLDFKDGFIVENPGDVFEGKLLLGDIVLSAEKAVEQSEEFGHSVEREIGFLVCHSTLHLLGYDHETDEDRALMRKKEEEVLEAIGLTR